jgi:dienelactone hydrolase
MKNTIQIDPIILQSNHHKRPFSIDVTYLADGIPKPVILHVHGFKGFKDWGYFHLLATYAAQKGYVFVKMNFSHNGTTPNHPVDFVDLKAFGLNNFSMEQDDMKKVIDFLCSEDFPVDKKEMDPDRLFLTGHSRGGAAVILKGYHDERVKATASWAGINNLANQFTSSQVNKWKENGVIYIENSRTGQQMPLYFQIAEDFMANKEKLDVPEAIKKTKKPLLIIHGSEDPTVPVKVAYLTKKWNPNAELYLIEGEDHVFGGKHPWDKDHLPTGAKQAIDRTLEFFKKCP